MKNLKEREWFFSQEKLPVELKNHNAGCKVYRLASSGHTICDIEIDTKKGGEPVTIGMCTDLHFNLCTKEDALDPEVNYTEQCRMWLANGKSIPQACKSLEALDYCDAGVVTGDILDYLSYGAIELTKRLIIKKYPDYLLAPGGHDITKQMQTGIPDQLPLEERVAILKEFWPHDLHYVSKEVGDKAIIVAIDNGQSKYLDCQIEKLAADIEKARREEKVVLIFQHEPISTGNPEHRSVLATIKASGASEYANFYTYPPFKDDETCDESTRTVYRMICDNADVVRGVFAGHWHSQFYAEINGSYMKDGERIEATIPHYAIYGNPYFECGYIARITVK